MDGCTIESCEVEVAGSGDGSKREGLKHRPKGSQKERAAVSRRTHGRFQNIYTS